MRAFTLLTLGIGVLVGLQAASAAGPSINSGDRASVPGAQPPAAEQFGEVVGSFDFPNPPIPPNPPYHSLTGLEHDGDGNLYCADWTENPLAKQFFVVTPDEPTAQLIDGPVDVQAHTGSPGGITAVANHVYIADVIPAEVDVYDLAGGYLASFLVQPHTFWPRGLTYSRITRHLYVVDGQDLGRVSEFDLNGNWVQDFNTLNGSSHDGLAFDPERCSYWLYDSGTDMVRHYDLNFVEMESFAGPAASGFGLGDGVAVIGDRLYVMSTMSPVSGWPTVVIFDVADAMVSDLCNIFQDGFESGDASAWSSVTP